MASAKLMIPKRSAPYYVLTANVTVHGKRVRRYGRFDFDPTVLKTHRQRENAAIEAALVFERAEQQKADDEKDGKNTPFRDAARAYIDSKKSMLDPSVRLEGDYEQHKNKANTTAGKETMLRRICEISPAFAEMPISKVNKRECEKFLDLLGEADVRSVKGYAVLKPNAKQYKKLSCPQIAAQCSIQTKSVERVFRGERTTLKTAQEIAAALKCKPEKLFHIELDHRPIARKTIKEYAIFLRLVMQYAEREYGIDNDTQTLAVKGTRSRPVDCLHPEEVEALFRVLPRCSTLEQVIVMGLLNTGMRRGELAGLTWEDIDFVHCTVHVDKSLLIVNKGKALDGSWTYDAYYLSFADGYLCDEHNYYITPAYSDEGWYVEKTTFADNRQAAGEQIDKTSYSANYHIHADNALAESQDQVAKGNVEISKIVSSSGQSNGLELEGAGFTFFLVSDLSKLKQFEQTRSGSYTLQSILDAYIDKTYDNEHPKWDFSAEMQAIAKTYEVNADEIDAYNKTLTAAGENKNGKGDGWQPTGSANEYQLAEIFSNDTGNIRVQGLPYGTYLVVETTVPHDLFQAEPFIVTVDPEQDNNPWGAMATPKDSVMTGSDSYQKFTVLDEEIEVYLRITKIDEETGKPVLLPDTAFQIYWLDEQGHYRYDSNGNPKLVTMTDTVNGHLTKDVNTFHTNGEGILTLPEKLPLGKYRIVEVTGPNGFYNEWLDSAGYENGVLADDADGSYYVDFEITTDRIYAATGDKNENGMDTLVIGENYSNHETLGKLTIRKTGEVLAGWKTEVGALDPWMTGEAEDGNFVYETRPLAGAEYTITAAEDIYTQDRQTDNYGNRTLWYAKGDVVAVVTTGDGSADIAAFAPARTKATYDFLSVIHDGTIGEVSVTLPLGSYHIEETKPPYGYIGTPESYDVTFAWDNERNDVVMATSIAKVDGAASSQSFEVVRSKDANADFTEQQTLKFYNDREKAKVGVYKVDRETGKYLAGAVFNLYAADDIYSVDGKLLFAAGELVATSPETGADGHTYFDCDIPIRGEYYGSSIRKDATTNSGNYIVKELRAPLGYYVNEEPMEVTFAYDGQAIMVLDNTCANKPTEMWVSKRDLTNDEELPGATLAIKDTDGNTVTTWVSTDEPHRVTGLHFGESYTLTEIRAADGYALANDITFRLIQKSDEDGNHLEECEVYYLTTKNILFWKWDDWKLLDDATVIMQDDITKVQISKKDLTTNEELPGAELVIKDKDGTEIDRWISTNGPHYVEKMPAGDYTLTEITAPNGYKVAESIDFTVLPTGEMQTVVMKDAREDTPTPTPDNTPTPDHTPQPTPNTTPAPTPVPAAPTATPTPLLTIPKTGDNSSLGLLLAIAGISLAGLAVLVHKSARRKDIAPRDDDDEDTED